MADAADIRAVIFARNLVGLTSFYAEALGLMRKASAQDHAVVSGSNLEIVIHQIPGHETTAADAVSQKIRREGAAIRFDFPVSDVAASRSLARARGGDIDELPPPWAERDANFFLGCDPEGNVFAVRQKSA